MKKQVVVVGLGRFGSSVARTLHAMGHDVLAIDSSEKVVEAMQPHVTYAVQADATNEAALKELGVSNFDLAVVAVASDIQTSLIATVLLKRLGVPYVIARAQSELHGSTLEKVGADRVVFMEAEMGVRVAHSLAYLDILDYMELIPNFGISKIRVPESFSGRTLDDVELGPEGKYGINVLAVKRGNNIIITPDRFERLQKDDILVLVGKDEQLEKLRSQ
ncbi:MAG: TrkA family potassium uptake protein [Chloroflexi bacterium]|nr:TrkA family potassium uptake protein [Chloroflexota bacterium]